MKMAVDTTSPSPSTWLSPSAAVVRQTRSAESVQLEHQLVRVPLEAFNSTARINHRLAQKEIAAVLSSASSAAAAPGDNRAAAVDTSAPSSPASTASSARWRRVRGRRSFRCLARLDRLTAASATEWEDMRLKRILVGGHALSATRTTGGAGQGDASRWRQ